MADHPRYWTRRFIDRLVDALNEDEGFQEETALFSDTIVLQCLDTPDGLDVRAAYSIDAGYVSVAVTEEEAPSKALRDSAFDSDYGLARATAPYWIWTQLDQGTMNVVGALASSDYQIDGPRLKIMMNLGILNAMSRVSAGIEKTY